MKKLLQQLRIQFKRFVTELQLFLIRLIVGKDCAVLIGWKIDGNGKAMINDPEFKTVLVAYCSFTPESKA